MNWDAFKTYELGYRAAFETLNNQLFERYIRRTYGSEVIKFRILNGSGGDGGVEAYAELADGNIIAIQSKWFRESLNGNQIRKINESIVTSKTMRPKIKEYIICIPHLVHSQKIGRSKKPTVNHEENKVQQLTDKIRELYPDLTLTWWFDDKLDIQLHHPDNEGVHKYWFEKEVLSLSSLKDLFELQKQNNWLKERYTPELHGLGIIYKQYQQMILDENYRNQLYTTLQETINKLSHCQESITEFLNTKEYRETIKINLTKIYKNLQEFCEELTRLQDAIIKGNECHRVKPIEEVSVWSTILELEKVSPTNKQRAIKLKLIQLLKDVHIYELPDYIIKFDVCLVETIKLFRGRAGTGKTHGLANCVEKHLKKELPAIIIQAKDTPCSSWTEILCRALKLSDWNEFEIFSALETVAVRQDVLKANSLLLGEVIQEPTSKVLICIDGLEEDTEKETDWCNRISETSFLASKYPRLRFLFSARDYFIGNCISSNNKIGEEINLPWEGDVPIEKVADGYLKEYKITISNLSIIKGLDSLLALRLFCQEYEGKEITSSTQIVTATRDLLKLKVERINTEFISSLQDKKGRTQQPVNDALLLIAENFYYNAEIEHATLVNILLPKVGVALNFSEVDRMLDFFVDNGILIRISHEDETSVLPKKNYFYRITYQSIIEHILSEKIYKDIKEARIEAIPDILHHGIARPRHTMDYDPFESPPNQQIIQSIINRLFIETGKLIGENDYLTEGFSEEDITIMKFEAIRSAPYERAIAYNNLIDRSFFQSPKSRYEVLRYLIVPSSPDATKPFGAEYIHDILINQPSAFERDKLWSGFDSFEQNDEETKEYSNILKDALDIFGGNILVLSEFEEYNEQPLLYAWALTTIDQTLRNALRIALTSWAIKRPEEFLKLLNKIFGCNDPQVHEDLASIMLGVASHINNSDQLKLLASWALKNVFDKIEIHRNVVVRQGFRAIVEKAFLNGSISNVQLQKSRPLRLMPIQLIPIEINHISDSDGGIYPIVKDLAWYVIKKAYDNFLEYPTRMRNEVQDNDCLEAKALLDPYRKKYKTSDLFAQGWAIAAAIAYIQNFLGLTRKRGNTWTEESHGSKSKIYTYEEKYTWLAVHYLQGYLSDYVPMKYGESKRKWVKDYFQIVDVPNPGEEVITDNSLSRLSHKEKNWVIKDDLAPTISLEGNIETNIKAWVQEEPKLNFSNWLEYEYKDFPHIERGKKWMALYNSTALEEASKAGYSHLLAIACIIKESEFEKFKEIIQTHNDRYFYFITDIDRLMASPDTHIYSNPTDIVWMNWIKEYSDAEIITIPGKEIKLYYTITAITQGKMKGEKHYKIPSKLLRKLLDIKSFSDPDFLNSTEQGVSFIHKNSEGTYSNRQEIVLVDNELLSSKLKEKKLKVCWFVDFFKRKSHNESLKQYAHDQKTRKYLVWQENEKMQSIKFWDEYFSSNRDEKKISK